MYGPRQTLYILGKSKIVLLHAPNCPTQVVSMMGPKESITCVWKESVPSSLCSTAPILENRIPLIGFFFFFFWSVNRNFIKKHYTGSVQKQEGTN